MFAGECRKQKVLFAIADVVALALAFAVALALHDPDGAILAHLESTGPQTLAECSVIASLLWVGCFRAFDLFTMRNGSRKEVIAIVKACSAAAGLMLLASFAGHVQISRVAVVSFYALSIITELGIRGTLRHLIRQFYSSPRISIPLVIIGYAVGAGQMCLEIGRRVESSATLGADVVDVDVASPHLCLTVNSEFVLAPLICGGECFVAEKSAAVGFI